MADENTATPETVTSDGLDYSEGPLTRTRNAGASSEHDRGLRHRHFQQPGLAGRPQLNRLYCPG